MDRGGSASFQVIQAQSLPCGIVLECHGFLWIFVSDQIFPQISEIHTHQAVENQL